MAPRIDTSGLLIIDMQNDFVQPGAPLCVVGAAATVPRIRRVLDRFRAQSRPVFHVVREYRADGSDVEAFREQRFLDGPKAVVPGTLGCESVPELASIEGEYRIVKKRFSAFMNTELELLLRRLRVAELIVTGTQYPNCVRATVFDAVALGYAVTLITDAASAQTEAVALANIWDIAQVGVRCFTTEQFVGVQEVAAEPG